MFLDERSANLIKILQHSPISKMKDIEDQTGLTRRQIQYAFGKVNDWLHDHGYPAILYQKELGYALKRYLSIIFNPSRGYHVIPY